MYTINNNTSWFDLKLQNDVNQTIEFDSTSPHPTSIYERVSEFFTGSSSVTDKMYSLVKAKLKDHITSKKQVDPDDNIIDGLAKQLLCECGLNYRDLNKTGTINKIFNKIEENIIDYFETKLPKCISNASGASIKDQTALFIAYLMGAPFNTKIISWEMAKAVIFQQNKEFKMAFQEILVQAAEEICLSINTGEITPEEKQIYEITLGNLLCLIPFAEPKHDSEITIPQNIEGKWQLVPYKVDVLTLNPEWLGGSMPAFGLTPLSKAPEGAQRVLLFRGTCQPTGNGFLCALFSDLLPGYSVGEFIYRHFAKDCIADWINKAGPWPEKAKVYGISLGGALALQAQLHHPDKIEELCIYGTPTPLSAGKPEIKNLPTVNAYINASDPIPLVGMGAHSHWNLHKLFVSAARPFIIAHAGIYSAFSKVGVIKIDPTLDSQLTVRKVMNVVHHILCLLIIPLILLLITLTALKYAASVVFLQTRSVIATKKTIPSPNI